MSVSYVSHKITRHTGVFSGNFFSFDLAPPVTPGTFLGLTIWIAAHGGSTPAPGFTQPIVTGWRSGFFGGAGGAGVAAHGRGIFKVADGSEGSSVSVGCDFTGGVSDILGICWNFSGVVPDQYPGTGFDYRDGLTGGDTNSADDDGGIAVCPVAPDDPDFFPAIFDDDAALVQLTINNTGGSAAVEFADPVNPAFLVPPTGPKDTRNVPTHITTDVISTVPAAKPQISWWLMEGVGASNKVGAWYFKLIPRSPGGFSNRIESQYLSSGGENEEGWGVNF